VPMKLNSIYVAGLKKENFTTKYTKEKTQRARSNTLCPL
jgi:hypothetical protein